MFAMKTQHNNEWLTKGGEVVNGSKIVCYEFYSLKPGSVTVEHFESLIGISNLRSQQIILSLYSYFVEGYERNKVCELYGVNNGYLSVKIKQLQELNKKIISMSSLCCSRG